ncbi:hypothetical protein BCEN4_740171 [Burkholderia cenocepacia]|nr:hypothetical protein BCEN4_740171 [Burkholderia cenocepacia]
MHLLEKWLIELFRARPSMLAQESLQYRTLKRQQTVTKDIAKKFAQLSMQSLINSTM